MCKCNTMIGTLATDGWAVTFGTARRGLGGLLVAVPNVTTQPSTASVPTSYYSILHYHCLMNCLVSQWRNQGFNYFPFPFFLSLLFFLLIIIATRMLSAVITVRNMCITMLRKW